MRRPSNARRTYRKIAFLTSPAQPGSGAIGAASPPSDLQNFADCLHGQGLPGALRFLNARTSHRYTGVFRFDGDTLRNVALIDRWEAAVTSGEDVPLARAYCAHLARTGESLEVEHGPTDTRVPWMSDSAILSYCGAVINATDGSRWGALCHFDTSRCDSSGSEVPLLEAAANLIYGEAAKASIRYLG
jgi:hypothetical protein